MSQSVKL